VSTHIAPDPSGIEAILQTLQGNIQLVKDLDGSIYSPSERLDELEHWNPLEAYMVLVEDAFSISFEGKPLMPQYTPLQLSKGWNLVPYLPEHELPADKAFASISDALVIAKDERGNAYIPAHGVNTLGMLTPDRGYKLYVSKDVELVYPSDAKALPGAVSISK
jgi:hypothetical protein